MQAPAKTSSIQTIRINRSRGSVSVFEGQHMANHAPARHLSWYIDFRGDLLMLSKLAFPKNVIIVNCAKSDQKCTGSFVISQRRSMPSLRNSIWMKPGAQERVSKTEHDKIVDLWRATDRHCTR